MITEDWALRMVTPKKGDYTRVPMTPAARQIADAWDSAKDDAAGGLPGRLRISWADDQTLKMELEAGDQTRTFHFNATTSRHGREFRAQSGSTPSTRRAAAS